MKKLVLLIFLIPFSSFANNCPPTIDLGIDSLQALISISEETADSKTYKKIKNQEHITVPGLTEELFQSIRHDPKKIAEVFGAKLIEEKGVDEFRLAIPVLGFDLKFDVKIKESSPSSLEVNLDNFNTFFHSGAAVVKTNSFEANAANISITGFALIPNSAANIFSFSVGGEENFKSVIQSEVENQVNAAINRFNNMYK